MRKRKSHHGTFVYYCQTVIHLFFMKKRLTSEVNLFVSCQNKDNYLRSALMAACAAANLATGTRNGEHDT